MIDHTSPELISESKRERLKELTDQEYMLWRHHPITAGFLQYLSDMIALYRETAADFVEARRLKPGDSHVDHNPDALSGQLFMLRQLYGLELATIHAFYGKTAPDEEQA